MSEEVSEQNHQGGRPRKWESDAERMAAKRETDREDAEKARRDDAYVAREVAITKARYADTPGSRSTVSLRERVKRTEEYARKWLAGEIGPRSTG